LHFGDKGKVRLAAGFSKLALVDETYWPMIGDRSKVEVLATAVEEGQEWPMLWTFEPGRGRAFASIIGHYSATHDDPLFRILVLRGIAWAAREPLDRFQKLAAPANEGSPGQ
jgi:type 1 glutamine amidotransferase